MKCWGAMGFIDILADFGQADVPQDLKDVRRWIESNQMMFSLDHLERGLINSAKGIAYLKNRVLHKLAEQLTQFKSTSNSQTSASEKLLTRLYVLLILDPFYSHIDSEYVEAEVYPKYTESKSRALETLGLSSVKDIPMNSEILKISITVIRVNLESSKYYLSKSDQDRVDVINAGLGEILVSLASDSSEVASGKISELMKLNTDLTTNLMSSSNTAAMGAMILETLQYLSDTR